MKAIYVADVRDGARRRPVVLLTRPSVVPHLDRITVAPITSTVRGLRTEVAVGSENGLDHDSVVSCDNIQTMEKRRLGSRVGELTIEQERQLTIAIHTAFDLL